LNYPVSNIILGNGQGFSSEIPTFGFPGGGLGPDNRVSLYLGDSWKVKPNLTVTAGLRYARDTGRTDSDLGRLQRSTNSTISSFNWPGESGDPTRPQFCSPTWICLGPEKRRQDREPRRHGLFYENSVWNNNLFDRPARLAQGLFLGTTNVCSSGSPQTLPFPSAIDRQRSAARPSET